MQMFKQFLLRLVFNAFGLWLSAQLISGISYENNYWVLLVAALVFSLVNVVLKPVLIVLSLPAIIMTLGLFTLLINGFLLYFVTVIYHPFVIETFTSALLAVMIIWIVNHGLDTIFGLGKNE